MNDLALPLTGPSKPLIVALWIAQILAAAVFVAAGLTKLLQPIAQLSAMMPWTGQYSEAFVRSIALIDLAGGLGLLLPALTRVRPKLTVAAALGCTVLQVLAMAFHISRSEFNVLPLNVMLLSLSVFVLWGRGRLAPIVPRA